MPISIRSATAASDLDRIQHLLAKCRLPGLVSFLPDNYFLVTARGEVVACAGLEVYGQTGLLRSLAVDEAERKRGFGGGLIDRLVARARQLGLTELYALTTTAQDYLTKKGFTEVPRSEAPACLKASDQYRDLCPASAALLKLTL